MKDNASDKTLTKIREQSETFMNMAEKKFGIHLDYSEEALKIADDLITVFFKIHREHYITATVCIGSYLGETVIKNLGGKWQKDLSIRKVGKLKGYAHPMTRAKKRLSNGIDDSLINYYKNLKLTSTRDGSFAIDKEKYQNYRKIILEGGWDQELLKRMLNEEEHRYVREEAAVVLGRLGNGKISAEISQAARDPRTVYFASLVLQGLPIPEAFEPLMENLQKSDSIAVQQQIILALGAMKEEKAIPVLIDFLKEDDEILGYFASLAIGKIGGEEALNKLLSIMAGLRPGKRTHAITSLELLGDKRATPALIEALFSRDEEVREAAARALQYIPDERAFKPLVFCLKDRSSRLRIYSAYALANIGNSQDAEKYIKPLLTDDVQTVRLHATHLMKWIKRGEKPQAKVL